MDKELFFLNIMNKTKILRPPKHTLATFGTTTFRYLLLSEISEPESQVRLREGRVTAQRPAIITPDLWRKRFEGFGDDTENYKGMMDQLFGDALRALEYTFKNELEKTSIEAQPLAELAERAIQGSGQEN